jgi:hypothetical protein
LIIIVLLLLFEGLGAGITDIAVAIMAAAASA